MYDLLLLVLLTLKYILNHIILRLRFDIGLHVVWYETFLYSVKMMDSYLITSEAVLLSCYTLRHIDIRICNYNFDILVISAES